MSGPKCIEIRRVPRAQAHRMNREFCASKLSWLERVGNELQQLDERLSEVGLALVDGIPDVRTLAEEVEQLIRADRSFDATQRCLTVAQAAEQVLSSAQNRLRERVAEISRRFRQLEVERQRVLSGRESLAQFIATVIPPDWPDSEQNRVKQLVSCLLQSAIVPESMPTALTRDAIARLEQGEAEATTSLRALAEGRQEVENLINATHARLLTERLTGTAKLPTFDEYMKTHARARTKITTATAAADKVAAKVDGLLSDIMMLEHTAIWADILRRGQTIREETDPVRQRMLYDALVIECSGHLKQLRAARHFQEEVHRLVDAAAPWKGTRVDPIVGELLALERSGVVTDLCDVEERLNRAIDEARRDLEREEKRRAILQALAEMGYSPREGMETALVRKGKCVVRRAADDGYGVEVSVDRDLTMVETELVRFVADDGNRLTQQQELADVRREEAWCEDYKRARELLAAKYGWQAELRYQLKPGQQPVKRVVDAVKQRTTETRRQSANRRISRKGQVPE